jgi:hypothetical protein
MYYRIRRAEWIAVVVVTLLVISAFQAWGQLVVLPRAKSAVTLFGFENTDAITGWKGLPNQATKEHFSEGAQAMCFTFPKYEVGREKWPQISIDWNGGKGYSTKDWSHYGKLVFDVWTDTKDPSDLALELNDLSKRTSGWAHHFTVQPGKKNIFSVDLVDTTAGVDLTNVRRIILFTAMPKSRYTITVDNFRLVPGDRPDLADVDIIYPNYRMNVFPNAKNIKLAVALHPEEYDVHTSDLAIKLTASAKGIHLSKTLRCKANSTLTSMAVDRFSAGPIKLTVDIVNTSSRKTLLSESWALRKLTRAEVSSLAVYIDEHNNTIVNGKPFFPIGWYDSLNPPYGGEDHIDDIAGGPFNCVLNYGMNVESKQKMLSYLDRVQADGMKAVYCMNDLYPGACDFKDRSWEGIRGNEKIADAVVETYRNHPALLGWYLNDELPKSVRPELTKFYRRVSALDTNHPCYIVLCTMPEVKYFSETTDIMGVDPYPIPDSPVTKVSEATDVATSAVKDHKPVWVVLEAFAWYQHRSSNPDRGHIPTAEELSSGRAPSYEESRCMTYLALVRGAKGIFYWCYYDMRLLPQYKEMWGWMKKIGDEVKTLSPVLLSADDLGEVKCSPSGTGICTKLKRYNGSLYLIAVNSASENRTVAFNIGCRFDLKSEVMFEDRSIVSDGFSLTDTFKPLAVHVYDLGK